MLAYKSLKLIFIPHFLGLLLLCALPARAQSGETLARKFDEFGDIQLSDLKARLDNFAIELQNNPTVRGFIMVYRSRRDLPGLNGRLLGLMKDYLANTRAIPAEQVITVDGGEASCLAQELWIAPPNTAPNPRADAYPRAFVDTESARKFDEYYYGLADGYNQELYEPTEFGESMESFAAALRKEPRAQAYIIAYSQYYVERWYQVDTLTNKSKAGRRVYLDQPGTTAKILRDVKAELVNKHSIAANRIKVINGGYRKLRYLELWIVPRGEHPPVSTPNAFPKRRRARR